MHLHDNFTHPPLINRAFCFILVVSIFALLSSIGIEELAKVQPCKICKLQRACYFCMIVLGFLGVFLQKKNFCGLLILLAIFVSLSLACYHIGIQLGIFTDRCAANSPADLNHFKKMLFQAPPSCASISWVFGLPISVWSLLFSLINFGTAALSLRRQNLRNIPNE